MHQSCRRANARPGVADWISANIGFLTSGHARRALDRRMHPGQPVPAGFFGICVAGAAAPETDAYIVKQLRELGAPSVRLDVSLPHPEPHALRLLECLAREGFRICLHPVAGGDRPGPAARADCLKALESLLDRLGAGLEMLELGATVNRRKWFRRSLGDFLDDYARAYRLAAARGIAVAAPNVTDFEPVYNAVLLDAMRRRGCPPEWHSDNLFVERAGEPEAYDHKIMGRAAAGFLKFDLVRKARVLRAVGCWAGVSRTLSAHTAWSLRRIARLAGDREAKQADYLSRYAVLAAAGGDLGRMYWGPLIGQREGLIDDGTDLYPPEIPHVTRYTQVPGNIAGFRPRPALDAYRTVIARLRDARFVRPAAQGPRLYVLEFARPDESRLQVAWTRDGYAAIARDVYPAAILARARAFDRDGRALAGPPEMLSESPCYLEWPPGCMPALAPDAAAVDGIRFECPSGTGRYARIRSERWTGFAAGTPDAPPPAFDALDPDGRTPPAGGDVLRDSRNLVWRISPEWSPGKPVVVKRFGAPRGLRLVLQCLKPSRARRSWNGAIELRRRGLPSPAPVAFLEARRRPAGRPGYYNFEENPPPKYVRAFFSAYARGIPAPAGMAQADFFRQCAAFTAGMHAKGVYFRDFSAGNILVTLAPDTTAGKRIGAAFSLIDTARARFFPHPTGRWKRLCDLMRICHPLDSGRRRRFLDAYLAAAGLKYRRWMPLPFLYYNAKHAVKNRLRRKHPN